MSLIPNGATHYKITKHENRSLDLEFMTLTPGMPLPEGWTVMHVLCYEFGDQEGAKNTIKTREHSAPLEPSDGESPREFDHYYKEIKPGVTVDVYNVCDAFTMPAAVDHAVKKCLASGSRGYKDQRQDIEEAIKSLRRQLEIIDEWA